MRPELLLSTGSAPVARYRRRILGLGLLLAAVVAAIGAPAYLRGIERDLERRVPEELATSGAPDVRAVFSGQQGTLHCDAPLDDPEAVLDVANAVEGVVLVDLDRSCRVSTAPTVPATVPPAPTVPSDPVDDADDDPVDDPAPTTTLAGPAAFDTVDELVRSSPRFSLLASLLGEADATDLFGVTDGPITVLAPHNDAFDELPADVLAELRTRPDLLAEVLRNHVVDDEVPLAELGRLADAAAAGDAAAVTTRLGTDLATGRTDGVITIDDARVLDGDLIAGDGRVHVLDRVLVPVGLDLRALDGLPEFVAVLRSGGLELAGSVRSADDRLRLIEAATTAVAPVNVTDEIEVEPSAALAGAGLDLVADLLPVVPGALTSGSVGFDGSEVFVRGTVVDDAALEVLGAAGAGATFELEPRPSAVGSDVVDLESELAEVLLETPVTFAPASADLDPSAAAVLDVLASVAKRFDGVSVLVVGHTDTDGDPQRNMELSELRAAVVRLELVARGVPGEQLDHVGRGGAEPVIVDGVEDKVASRRVDLEVTLAS